MLLAERLFSRDSGGKKKSMKRHALGELSLGVPVGKGKKKVSKSNRIDSEQIALELMRSEVPRGRSFLDRCFRTKG